MDNGKGYSREIVVLASVHDDYLALTEGIGKWWVASEGKSIEVGDTPTFRFGETYWKMRVKELISDKKVVWECIEANHIDEIKRLVN